MVIISLSRPNPQEDKRLLSQIKQIHAESRQIYGSPRIGVECRARGERCSRKRVCRLMKLAGMVSKMNKRFKITTRANPAAAVALHPNQHWVAALISISTREGWLYVAVILDLFSRRIVGIAMKERMTAALVTSALQQALICRKPTSGLIHHSDRGSQYTSEAFKALSTQHQIQGNRTIKFL